MSEIKLTKDSIQNAILTDSKLVGGYVDGDGHISAKGNGAVAFGYANGGSIDVSGNGAHAEGIITQALADGAHAEGYQTTASGDYSHAEGYQTIASGESSHAEGESTKAIGNYSHAEGNITTASGNASHAEGSYVVAKGKYSHAEGEKTIAFGDYSHVEGKGATGALGPVSSINSSTKFILNNISTTITGQKTSYTLQVGDIIRYNSNYAKVITIEENNTITTDKDFGAENNKYIQLLKGVSYESNAHSEGYLTIASGTASHAEGQQTIASGTASHAGGIGTIANKEAMTAIGKYNNTAIGNIGGDYLFVVGNGSSPSSRSNAFAVTTHGIAASFLNLSGGPYQNESDPTNYSGGNISWGDTENCWIAETGEDQLTIYSSGNLYLQSDSGIYANTNVSVTGQVKATLGFYDESDIRKKEILSNISLEKSYELLDKCQEIIYVLKDDPDKKEQVGMIAQEVEEFFPEIVSTDNEGFKSLDYARLSVICLRLIKDIVEQIKEIKNEIKNLKN